MFSTAPLSSLGHQGRQRDFERDPYYVQRIFQGWVKNSPPPLLKGMVLYISLWTRALYSAYLSDTSGHRRSFVVEVGSNSLSNLQSVRPQQQLFA